MIRGAPDNTRAAKFPVSGHFTVSRKLGFKSVTVRCWCGATLDLAANSTAQGRAFLETHEDSRAREMKGGER